MTIESNESTLKDAFTRFKSKYFEKEPALYQTLTTDGQAPKVMLITCSDSRIVPDHLFDTQPGDLFVVRSVANLIHAFDDPQQCTQAALEYAVCHLNVEHIIILGHSQCGGINALLQREEGKSAGACIDAWIKGAASVAKKIKQDHATKPLNEQCYHAELGSIQHSLALLAEYPFVRDKLSHSTLQLHGWYFELQQGKLLCYDPKTNQFT